MENLLKRGKASLQYELYVCRYSRFQMTPAAFDIDIGHVIVGRGPATACCFTEYIQDDNGRQSQSCAVSSKVSRDVMSVTCLQI